jgi:SAM-dependent methyltransferase
MQTPLVVKQNKEKYDDIYRKGYDKKYPNLDLVRMERWYFKGKPGRVLEFAFGTGVNMIHMLECGYDVDAIEASGEAKKIVEAKLAKRPEFKGRARLAVIAPDSGKLPYEDNTFDYVLCLSVLSLLETKERVEQLLAEFKRVMKPGAKMILDLNGPNSDFSKVAKRIREDIYEYRGQSGTEDPRLCYCPQTEDRFRDLLKGWTIDDVGFVAFKYLENESFEYIACVRKPV